MLFKAKPTTILYLRRQDVVYIDKSSSIRLDISQDIVHNLELLDSQKLTTLVARFLADRQCKNQHILLILDSSVIFQQKLVANLTEDKRQTAIDDFASKVPFNPEDCQIVVSPTAILYGTNQALIRPIIAAIIQANKLYSILPAAAFGVEDSRNITHENINNFFTNSTHLGKSSFLIKL